MQHRYGCCLYSFSCNTFYWFIFVFQSYYTLPKEEVTGSDNIELIDFDIRNNEDGTYTIIENGKERIISRDELLAVGSEILNE